MKVIFIGGLTNGKLIVEYIINQKNIKIPLQLEIAPTEFMFNFAIKNNIKKVCIVPDDIIDTAGTLCNAANALKENGAKAVKAYITHPVLSGPAIERLENSSIDELIVTNSIPLTPDAKKCSKIRVISLANIIAECIKRLSNEESLSEMFL